MGTVASDAGSGVLILRGVTGRLLRKSGQPNKVPVASKTFTDSAVASFAVPGFHLTMRPSTNPFLLRGKVRLQAGGGERGPGFVWLRFVRDPHGAVFVVFIAGRRL